MSSLIVTTSRSWSLMVTRSHHMSVSFVKGGMISKGTKGNRVFGGVPYFETHPYTSPHSHYWLPGQDRRPRTGFLPFSGARQASSCFRRLTSPWQLGPRIGGWDGLLLRADETRRSYSIGILLQL